MIIVSIPEWIAFIGRFHPLAVHLPIGFFVIIVFFEILNKYSKIEISTEIVNVSLLITAFSATFACILGYSLSLEGGYNAEILEEHQWQGIGLAGVTWLIYLVHSNWIKSKFEAANFLYLPLLGFGFLLMMVAGHHGGNLTHGEAYLTENTPNPFRKWLGMPDKENKIVDNEVKTFIKDINQVLVYQDIVKPIFKQKCEQCHNASKMKGNLRMDDLELLKKGGKHGVIFKASNVEESEFINRILLPEADEEHMPPKGKNQINENELVILKWWIQQGASFDKKVSQLTVNDEVKPILAAIGGGASAAALVKQDKFVVEDAILTQSVSKVGQADIEIIKKAGGLILPLSQNNNYIELTFLNNPKFSDKDASLISTAPMQTLWLKLSNTQITDNSCEYIAKLSNLTRLHLENTKITDAALRAITPLQNLEYLNLTNTAVTDKGLMTLAPLKNLKKIYLWKTRVTGAGIENLKKNLPNLIVEIGINEGQMAELSKSKVDEKSDDVYKK